MAVVLSFHIEKTGLNVYQDDVTRLSVAADLVTEQNSTVFVLQQSFDTTIRNMRNNVTAPTICQAMKSLLEMVRCIRKQHDVPMVLVGWNSRRYGLPHWCLQTDETAGLHWWRDRLTHAGVLRHGDVRSMVRKHRSHIPWIDRNSQSFKLSAVYRRLFRKPMTNSLDGLREIWQQQAILSRLFENCVTINEEQALITANATAYQQAHKGYARWPHGWSTPRCSCPTAPPLRVRTSRTVKNPGRHFFICTTCRKFHNWLDQMNRASAPEKLQIVQMYHADLTTQFPSMVSKRTCSEPMLSKIVIQKIQHSKNQLIKPLIPTLPEQVEQYNVCTKRVTGDHTWIDPVSAEMPTQVPQALLLRTNPWNELEHTLLSCQETSRSFGKCTGTLIGPKIINPRGRFKRRCNVCYKMIDLRRDWTRYM